MRCKALLRHAFFWSLGLFVGLSPDSPHDSECLAYAESIQASGRMLAAEPLESVTTATTVRMRSGKLSITDGPFAADSPDSPAQSHHHTHVDSNTTYHSHSRYP